MAHVDFDGVEPGVAHQARRTGVLGDGAGDVRAVHGAAEGHAGEHAVLVDAGARAARPWNAARLVAAEIAAMRELRGNRAAFGMHGGGQTLQLRDNAAVHPHLVGEGQAIGRHAAVGHRGQADTTARHAGMVIDQVVAGDAVGTHPLEGRGLDDTIAQRQAGQPGGAQQPVQFVVHAHSRASKATNSATSSSKPETAL
ncbi:hypothetical protein FQZ97_808120 [compost metagenome]